MADAAPAERKQRKSVAFSEGATIVDENGGVTNTNGHSDKNSAESHSKSPDESAIADDKEDGVDEITSMMEGLAKKKKKSKKPKEEGADDEAKEGADGDAEVDLGLLKKVRGHTYYMSIVTLC